MLSLRALKPTRTQCRAYSTARRFQLVQVLPDGSLNTFRKHAFEPKVPALLPRQTFRDWPAVSKWFANDAKGSNSLNLDYLAQYGDTSVPLELTDGEGFERVEQPLRVFLEASIHNNPTTSIYLAQAPIPDLPQALRKDVSTPSLILQAGKGDIYDSSIWLGRAPTYTPLHRDPNPNLFAQLAGKKIVRLFKPNVGNAIFARVQERIGGAASATMRGEEMMRGAEKEALEREVWEDGDVDGGGDKAAGFEAELESGDGLFIPKGWWHSIKGVGEGMTGSVNWWFR